MLLSIQGGVCPRVTVCCHVIILVPVSVCFHDAQSQQFFQLMVVVGRMVIQTCMVMTCLKNLVFVLYLNVSACSAT